MARIARVLSVSGMYHVIVRGIDKRNIFIDDQDKAVFLNYIKRAQNYEDSTAEKDCRNFHLYAYCIMDNHAHLVIKAIEPIAVTVKRITSPYALYHNNKYERFGHLFENRFHSECIEDARYLKNAIRYTHRNPLLAGMVTNLHQYYWCSVYWYAQYPKMVPWLQSECIMETYFAGRYDLFNNFCEKDYGDEAFQEREAGHKRFATDSQIHDLLIRDFFKEFTSYLDMGDDERREFLRVLKSQIRTNHTQLARVLGVSRGLIRRSLKE